MGKPCYKTAHTFNLEGAILYSTSIGGGFVTYCHWLSKDITHTYTVIERGTTSYEVITLGSNQIYKRVLRNCCLMCGTHWPWSSLSGRNSANDPDLCSERGALVRTLEVSRISSASPDEWCNSKLYLLVNVLRPPHTKSLYSHCSYSISLLAVSCITAAVEISSLHNSWISH
jgi:hypothetical protein